MLVIITGTPGVGKTTLAKKIVKLGYTRLDLHDHYKEISTRYDRKKQCYDIDVKKFTALVKKKVKEHEKVVVDSHISHLLPKKMVDLCIILTCSDLKKLKRRLVARKYSKKKIEENIQAEIFQVCLEEAKGHNVKVFDVAHKDFTSKINKLITKVL